MWLKSILCIESVDDIVCIKVWVVSIVSFFFFFGLIYDCVFRLKNNNKNKKQNKTKQQKQKLNLI